MATGSYSSQLNLSEAREIGLGRIIEENTAAYAREVATNRAFPRLEDGLLPVQRFVAYATSELAGPKNTPIKSNTICGDVIGKYHPHSDRAAYATLVSMTEEHDSIIKSMSTMSTRLSTKPTASRYTIAMLSPLGVELIRNSLNTGIVESEVGYDVPASFKSRFPIQMSTYNSSIAVGYGSNAVPFSLRKLVEANIAVAEARRKGKRAPTKELAEIIEGPELYENSIVYMSPESLELYIDKGYAHCMELCPVSVSDNKIRLTELPFRVKQDDLIREIYSVFHEAKIDFTPIDNTKEGQIDVTLVIKNIANVKEALNLLFTQTSVKKYHTIKNSFLVRGADGKDKLEIIPARDIFDMCIEHNLEYFLVQHQEELDALERRQDINIVLEKLTRPAHVEFVGQSFYKKNKKDLLLEREGLDLTKSEVDNIVFKEGSILRNLSERDRVLKELAEYEALKKAIMDKMTEKYMLGETIQYLNYIKTLTKDKKTVVYLTEPSKVEVKPREEDELNYYTFSYDNGHIQVEKVPYKTENTGDSRLVFITDRGYYSTSFKSLPDKQVMVKALMPDNAGTKIFGCFSSETPHKYIVLMDDKGRIRKSEKAMLIANRKFYDGFVFDEDVSKLWLFECDDGDEIAMLSKSSYETNFKILPVDEMIVKMRKCQLVSSSKFVNDETVRGACIVKPHETSVEFDVDGKPVSVRFENTEERNKFYIDARKKGFRLN